MTPIQAKIEEDFLKAYRAKEKISVEVLRLLKTQLANAEIEKRTKEKKREVELTEEETETAVRRQLKNLEEALELFQKGGRPDLVQQTQAEIQVVKRYLPAELGEEAVRAVVLAKIESMGKPGPSEFGKVMSEAMRELKGKASGEVVAKLVKEMLTID